MSLPKWGFWVIALISMSLSIAHADDALLKIPDDADIGIIPQKGIDIRTMAPPDIRTIHKLMTTDINGRIIDLNQAIVDLNADVRKNQIFIELSADVLFDFDKSDVKPKAETELTKLAKVITEKAQGTVTITGHTDSKGSDSYNQNLSMRRAKAIQKWLTEIGRVVAEFKIEGFGESKPVAENTTPDGKDNPEGRAKNRRVEIQIQTNK